jgi:hypothetical protein
VVFNAWATLGGGVRFHSGAHLECWEAEVRLTRKSRHSRDGALSSALGNNQTKLPVGSEPTVRTGHLRTSRMCILLLRTATFSSSRASKSSQKTQSVLVGAGVIERLFQTFRALPETPSFFIRHFRLQHLNDPAAAEHTRQ